MTYIIAEPCLDIKDKACVDVCPVDCIYEGDRFLYINPDECVDCAACEPVCPVEAIYPLDQLPEEYEFYDAVNAEFFTEVTDLGTTPGGAAAVGAVAADHPVVAAKPRQTVGELS
ncbi:NAD-dependent dihydropyrimidine dehydrogenase PreA subunit [Amycolatopsis sulphurea]|uniref:Ferredoxin n=1 Tax=Amycolatopsis sulphurea TaxID=76022 RepID=A0A2A9FEH8_9PSEU|nr:ferredoxin [Amycolatopsis sulphurea]PFG49151.1 NAD-dependent dihydropyrimidine dehydrogenase PreA subunit [Amycolatopsis sulphurea]